MTNFKNFVVRKGLEVAESIKLNGKTVTSLIDSGGATSLIDSSYIQTRQTTYSNSDFADSAFVVGW